MSLLGLWAARGFPATELTQMPGVHESGMMGLAAVPEVPVSAGHPSSP